MRDLRQAIEKIAGTGGVFKAKNAKPCTIGGQIRERKPNQPYGNLQILAADLRSETHFRRRGGKPTARTRSPAKK